MTQNQVGRAMRVVPSTVSAWECGTRGLQQEQAEELDRIFGTSGVVVRAWTKANTPTALPEWYEEVEQLEGAMSELREYQPLVVPGLIQTEEYMRALGRDATPWVRTQELNDMVTSRMRRQEILGKDNPPLTHTVLEMSALTRIVGDREVLSRQLQRVLTEVEKEVIRLQVVPANPGYHPGAAGPFRVYSFPDKPMAASAEHQGGEVLMDEIIKVQQCMTVFGALQAEALSPRQSADFIRNIKEELDGNEA